MTVDPITSDIATSAADDDSDFSDLNVLDPPPPSAPIKQKFEWSKIVGPLIILVLFLAFWHYMHNWGMRAIFDKPGFLVPAPETVVDRAFLDSNVRGQLITGVKWTALVAGVGLVITIVIGMSLAVLMAEIAWAERAMYPYLVALQAIPILAIVPLIYSAFGGGMNARLFVCIMIAIFPIVTNTLFGLMSAEIGQHELFTLRHASRTTRLFKLQFPAALPAIFTGFRISAGLVVIGAVVGEQFFRQGGRPGIGIIMEQFRQKSRYPELYGGLMMAAFLGISVFFFFGWLQKKAIGKWYVPVRKGA